MDILKPILPAAEHVQNGHVGPFKVSVRPADALGFEALEAMTAADWEQAAVCPRTEATKALVAAMQRTLAAGRPVFLPADLLVLPDRVPARKYREPIFGTLLLPVAG